jgi:indolepyruvate decarboxylase
MATMTVGKYLIRRLQDAGLKHIFGVPGDYTLNFFDYLEESNVKLITTCNELNAGYAADAYARLNGIGAVCVTYGVGGFSVFNAAVGAFAERVPLIIISGGPRASEHKHHHLLHHTIGDMNLQYNIYEKITAKSVILLNSEQAPQQIDETILACLRFKRPVYIEIPTDIVSMPCAEPGLFKTDTIISADNDVLEEAANEAAAMLTSAKKVVVIAGVEAHRFGICRELEDFINHSGYPFTTTLLDKTVIAERHPQFLGVYCGALFQESVRLAIEEAEVVLCLGTLMTDINLGVGTARINPSKTIIANSDKVRIKHHVYSQVVLSDFIKKLRLELPPGKPDLTKIEHPSRQLKEDFAVQPEEKISLKRFYQRLNHFIDKDYIIIADAGDSLFCSAELYMPEGAGYIGQAFYLSIGFSIPAALGIKLAAPSRRPIVFVGDGAFQMTVQELSTIIRHNLNPIIFLMNNEGYTIERVIDEGPYNDVNVWKYHLLPEVFGGGWGCEVKTEAELERALKKAKDNPGSLALIEVWLDKLDCSQALKNLGRALREINK